MKTEQSLNEDLKAGCFFEKWFHETEARDSREWNGKGEKVVRCFLGLGNWSSLPLDPYTKPCGYDFPLRNTGQGPYTWACTPHAHFLPGCACGCAAGAGHAGAGRESYAVTRWSAVVLSLCATGYSSKGRSKNVDQQDVRRGPMHKENCQWVSQGDKGETLHFVL